MKPFNCTSCGNKLRQENAVGQWIVCPVCGSRYLIDNTNSSNESDERGSYDDYLMGHKELDIFFFRTLCNYQFFREQCFDTMMHYSPSDIFSTMQIVDEKQCYLPYICNIGGDTNSIYKAVYVGEDDSEIIIRNCKEMSFKNSDSRFGALFRTRSKDVKLGKEVLVDQKRKETLPNWISHTDELHYYPFYSLECNYDGKQFSFFSLGDSNIQSINLPIDKELHKKPKLIQLSKEQIGNYVKIIANIAVALLAICLVVVFWQMIVDLYAYIKEFASIHWPIMLHNSGWFAYVLASVTIFLLFVAVWFSIGVAYGVSFGVFWILTKLAFHIGIYRRNNNIIQSCLKKLRLVQSVKQQAAYSRFGITLNKLYVSEQDLQP